MVSLERFEGEVSISHGSAMAGAEPGQILGAGTRVRAGVDGRVELSVGGSPTLALGNGGELAVDDTIGPTLRMTLARGAVHVDTRAQGSRPRRDLFIQLGEVGLRVNGAEVWAALNNDIAQVCTISGAAEAQLQTRTDRLELSGQCLSRAGLESRWVMVPAEVLSDRTALLHVRVRESVAGKPSLPDLHKNLPTVEPMPPRGILPDAGSPPVAAGPPGVSAAAPAQPSSSASVVVKPAVRELPLPSATTPAAVPEPSAPPPAPGGDKHWSVVLASLDTLDAAEIEAARLRRQGLHVEIREYVSGERRGYRVGHGRFDSRADAQAAFESLRHSHPKISGWMANY